MILLKLHYLLIVACVVLVVLAILIQGQVQCAGNRRTEMSTRRKVKGVGWGAAALGTGNFLHSHIQHVFPPFNRLCIPLNLRFVA